MDSKAQITHFDSAVRQDIGNGIDDFLTFLPGPSRIHVPGRDSSRCRILVTLLHGNEPSGIRALHTLLKECFFPAVDIYCYLMAIEAAELAPRFTFRQVPGKRDYNRCFLPPFDSDDQGPVCQQLLEEIQQLNPEAVVDMHNTSGEGPSFGVVTRYDARHDRIVSLFTDRCVVTELRLGALMETSTAQLPVVTVECGGAFEAAADRIALDGMTRYFGVEALFREEHQDLETEVFFHPMRVEMNQAEIIACAEHYVPGSDITLTRDIEHHNFGLVTPDTLLGWVAPGTLEKMAAFDTERTNHFRSLYREEEGGLYPRCNQKLFMITSNLAIARSDCLWYTALTD
ncbi:MAG: succinylglutamate desuccinylase [Gammaproteobacteria bacterium]|nr:hypothetical protein [Pseudomonadales bacterium]MCP5345780.1 succinylglutamate desuccinylase [Pseudomonadales bacterium]